MAKRRCTGTRLDGKPCKANPLKGTDRCGRHPSDPSKGSRIPAREAWDRDAWLAEYEATLMVAEACRRTGIAQSTVYLERQRNEAFADAWDRVRVHVVRPSLEEEAYRRAVHGVEKMIVSAGRDMGTEMAYSDTLLVALLKANVPKYRDRVDVAHSGGLRHDVTQRVDLSKLTDEQLDQLDAIEDALKADESEPS